MQKHPFCNTLVMCRFTGLEVTNPTSRLPSRTVKTSEARECVWGGLVPHGACWMLMRENLLSAKSCYAYIDVNNWVMFSHQKKQRRIKHTFRWLVELIKLDKYCKIKLLNTVYLPCMHVSVWNDFINLLHWRTYNVAGGWQKWNLCITAASMAVRRNWLSCS